MRPRRLSKPTRSERIRERRATSSEPSSTGTCTRRPSLVTTTATRRRSRSFQVGTVRAVYVPLVGCATAPKVTPPGNRNDRRRPAVVRMLRTSVSAPAVASLDKLARVRSAIEDPTGVGRKVVLHGLVPPNPGADGQRHRAQEHDGPGEARQVRLHRFSFPKRDDESSWTGGRAVSLGEIPGFASPPHDGFALDDL